ncbi:DHHW family protein [Dysosmobacter sp.]|uniref:DHHW family protein n=1 Tax=Dysosmobacter sp. TaxID=2591382 RepID=UPI003A954BD0
MRNKIITSFFCLLLAVSALIGLLMPDRYYSEREKRTLTQKPKFTVANFISGEFSDELEKYLTDQVPLRDGWVTMKTYMELAIGKRESVGVYICKDKYLMDKFTSYSKKQLVANAAALVDLQEKLAAEGISMNTILVPMAAQVLTDKLPAYAPVADYAAILQVLTDAGVDTTDVLSALVAHSSENIYYRTDHHWTSLGAYYAYCAWRGIEPNVDEWTQEVLCDDFYGTTWNKVPLPTVPAEEIAAWYKHINRSVSYNNGQYETDSIYERKYLSGSDQYAVFLNSNQAQTVIEGSGKSGKLLLIKDSYGNTFSQFPVEDYAEVHVLDLRFFKGDVTEYAKENGITDTLVLYGTQSFVKDTRLRF